MFRKLKQRLRRRRLGRLGIDVEQTLPLSALGEGGGAWSIVDQELNRDSIIYSVGVGTNISFDLAIAEKLGCDVHLFDPTPRSIDWVKSHTLPNTLHFHEYGLAGEDGDILFYPPRRERSSHFSPVRRGVKSDQSNTISAPVFRLQSIMQKLGHTHVDLLKVDIEGGEYDAIDDILASDIEVRQLAVEFHHCFKTIPIEKTVSAIAQLREAGFKLVYISPRTNEFTLFRSS